MQFDLLPDIRWLITIALSSMTFGVVSPLVLSRRLLFLASSLPHSALLSALLAMILDRALSIPYRTGSLVLSVILVSTVFYMISRGARTDVATAIFLSLTVSLTALSLYYVITSFSVKESVWSYLVGDPLLVTWDDVYYTAFISLLVLGINAPLIKVQAFIGADRDFVRISGVKIGFYDLVATLSLAIATVGLLKVTGFVLEHVMILLPGVTAASLARSLRGFLIQAFMISLVGGLGGLMLGLLTGLAPSGCVGLVLLSLYLISLIGRGGK